MLGRLLLCTQANNESVSWNERTPLRKGCPNPGSAVTRLASKSRAYPFPATQNTRKKEHRHQDQTFATARTIEGTIRATARTIEYTVRAKAVSHRSVNLKLYQYSDS